MAFNLNNIIKKKYGDYYIYRDYTNYNIISIGYYNKVYLKGQFTILGIFKQEYELWIWGDSFPIIDKRDIKLTEHFRETYIPENKLNNKINLFKNNNIIVTNLNIINEVLEIFFNYNKDNYVGIFFDKINNDYIYYLITNKHFYNI